MPSLDRVRIRRLAKEGGWIVIGQVVAVLGSLMLVRVLTEHLDPSQYGQLALGLTVAGLVNQVAMGGVCNGIGRYYSIGVEKKDLPGYLSASRRLVLYATLSVLIMGLALLLGLCFLGYSQWMGLAAAALGFSILSGYNSTLSGIQNAARQRAVVAFHGGLDAWLKILLALGMLLWVGDSGTAAVIGYGLSSLLVTGSQYFFLMRLLSHETGRVGENVPWMRQIWSYSWPFSVWGLFTWLQQSSDRWALAAMATPQEVGQYTVLFQLGYAPVSMATGLAINFLGPILYQRSGDATDHGRNAHVHRLAWRITSFGILITLIAVLFALMLHAWIFRLLVASEYRYVSYLLPWMVLAGGLFAAGQVLALKLMSDMQTSAMASAKIITAIVGVLFNIYGASAAGLQGIVGALIGFSVVYFAWMVFLSLRVPSEVT